MGGSDSIDVFRLLIVDWTLVKLVYGETDFIGSLFTAFPSGTTLSHFLPLLTICFWYSFSRINEIFFLASSLNSIFTGVEIKHSSSSIFLLILDHVTSTCI